MNVSGSPITNQTLKQMSRYKGKKITQEDRAREAMRMMQSEGKNMDALNKVLDLKKQFGTGCCTLVLIYNATGDQLKLVKSKDFAGHTYSIEPATSFENGQWLVFLHVRRIFNSSGARVYRGKNIDGYCRDFLVAWSTPYDKTPNSVFTDVGNEHRFAGSLDCVEQRLKPGRTVDKDEDYKYCKSYMGIGGMASPECIAILKHKFSPNP